MDESLNLLVIEDTAADFLLIKRNLQKNELPASCHRVSSFAELSASLSSRKWDAVLSDYNVPGMEFSENLRLVRSVLPEIPFILLSGTVGDEKAVELLKLGVTDFILKDNLTRLVPAIHRALREVADQHARRTAEHALRVKDQLLREMSALAHIGGWEYDPASRRFSWTEEVARIYETDPLADASFDFVLGFFQGEWREKIEAAFSRMTGNGAPFDLELPLLTSQGNHKWLRIVGAPVNDGKQILRIRGSIQDITDRKRSEIMLFEQKERAEVTLHSIGDAVISTDRQGNIDYVNLVAEKLTGWSMCEAIGKPLMEVLNIVDESKELPLSNPVNSVLSEGKTNRLPADCLLIRRDGKRSAIEDSAAPIRGRDGSVIGAVLVFHDITEAREITAKIAFQATHDALTGLPNRILAWDRLEQAIAAAQRESHCVGILFLDLDRFKNINDSLGHSVGDQILKEVASRLRSVTRTVDTISRQGGDEFIIIMPDAHHRTHFADVAKKVLDAVSAPYYVKHQELSLTFSIGISVYPHDGHDATSLIKNADAAMYHAKAAGRDNYQFYAQEMNSRAAERLSLEAQLRHGVARQEFVIHYQPKVSIVDKKLIGAEALIRWNHPQSGLLKPASFIGIAEESGLIVPIGHWIKEEVCRQNQEWLARGHACVPISVNLSAIQFRNKSLVDSLRIILDETGLPPELLELELTESFIMHDTQAVIQTLHKLKDLGISLSIDDFGTGYSSLSYLKRFPIDTLKIDQAFVRDVVDDEHDGAIVRAIISMAHSLRMRVIAEGVETQAQFAFLETNRCDEIQGNYFSRPVVASAFEQMLKTPRVYH